MTGLGSSEIPFSMKEAILALVQSECWKGGRIMPAFTLKLNYKVANGEKVTMV